MSLGSGGNQDGGGGSSSSGSRLAVLPALLSRGLGLFGRVVGAEGPCLALYLPPRVCEPETLGGGLQGAKGPLRASPPGLSGQDWREGRAKEA